MTRPRVLAIIQAGGRGGRMDVLTRETPKPALPYAGRFRLIDFALSNLRNSGIEDVWVSVQYLSQTIADVLANGKPWDLDRHRGGFRLVVPQEGAGSPADAGFVSGNAEELLQNRDAIRQHAPDAVVVLSSDHVYRLDYGDVVQAHLHRGAECTIVTTEVDRAEARHHATVECDDDGLVRRFAYKPESPTTGTVATEVFVYHPGALIEVLETEHRRLAGGRADEPDDEPDDEAGNDEATDGSALGDFGEHLVPALVERGKVYGHPLQGYWRDLGRLETYVAAHRDLLLGDDLGLFAADWPIVTNGATRLPARFHPGSEVVDSLVSDGCEISGRVHTSVLGPGTVVAAGATVRDSVVFDDVKIGPGATVDWAILDTGTVIEASATVGERNPDQVVEPDRFVVVGRDSRVGAERALPAGSRLEPGTTS